MVKVTVALTEVSWLAVMELLPVGRWLPVAVQDLVLVLLGVPRGEAVSVEVGVAPWLGVWLLVDAIVAEGEVLVEGDSVVLRVDALEDVTVCVALELCDRLPDDVGVTPWVDVMV